MARLSIPSIKRKRDGVNDWEIYEGQCMICQDWQYGQVVKTNKNLDTTSSVYIATDGAIRKV